MSSHATSAGRSLLSRIRRMMPALPAHDLLRDASYRRLWASILISSLGGQITMLALPLTAAVLLHATTHRQQFVEGHARAVLPEFEHRLALVGVQADVQCCLGELHGVGLLR